MGRASQIASMDIDEDDEKEGKKGPKPRFKGRLGGLRQTRMDVLARR